MGDNDNFSISDKVLEALKNHYSIQDANELAGIITDPDKSVREVIASIERLRNRADGLPVAQQQRIEYAAFYYPNEKDVYLTAQIDGVRMPFRKLNDSDSELIRKMNGGQMRDFEWTFNAHKLRAKDLAATYYSGELALDRADLLQTVENCRTILTEKDARTFADLRTALADKYPGGVNIQMEHIDRDILFDYVYKGHFMDESIRLSPLGKNRQDTGLSGEIRVPVDKLDNLTASLDTYRNEEIEELVRCLGTDYDAATTELLHTHPDLTGAQLAIYDNLLPKLLHIEGQPLDKSVSWLLQKPDILDEELKKVLHQPIEAERMLDDIRSKSSPGSCEIVIGDERIYIFEKGVLGFAEVDRMRGVRYNGDTMAGNVQDFINRFVAERNVENRYGKTFFYMPGADTVKKVYLDTRNGGMRLIDIQKDMDGKEMMTDGTKVLKLNDIQFLQDITGRITDARIVGMEKPMIRCRIDGVLMPGAFLTKMETIRMGHYSLNDMAMERFAHSVAVAHFGEILSNAPEHKREGGMKR